MQMELLREGLSHAQVGQRPFEMGYQAMQLLRDLARGLEVPEHVYTGLDVCLAENAEQCVGRVP
jgi:ribose transport system substrate-binding protein